MNPEGLTKRKIHNPPTSQFHSALGRRPRDPWRIRLTHRDGPIVRTWCTARHLPVRTPLSHPRRTTTGVNVSSTGRPQTRSRAGGGIPPTSSPPRPRGLCFLEYLMGPVHPPRNKDTNCSRPRRREDGDGYGSLGGPSSHTHIHVHSHTLSHTHNHILSHSYSHTHTCEHTHTHPRSPSPDDDRSTRRYK